MSMSSSPSKFMRRPTIFQNPVLHPPTGKVRCVHPQTLGGKVDRGWGNLHLVKTKKNQFIYVFKSFDSMGELKTFCIGQAPLIWLCHKPQINFKILKKSLSCDQNIWLLWQLQNNFSKWQNGKMLIEMMFCSTWNSCATRRSWRVYRWGCIAMNIDRLGLVGTGWDGLV